MEDREKYIGDLTNIDSFIAYRNLLGYTKYDFWDMYNLILESSNEGNSLLYGIDIRVTLLRLIWFYNRGIGPSHDEHDLLGIEEMYNDLKSEYKFMLLFFLSNLYDVINDSDVADRIYDEIFSKSPAINMYETVEGIHYGLYGVGVPTKDFVISFLGNIHNYDGSKGKDIKIKIHDDIKYPDQLMVHDIEEWGEELLGHVFKMMSNL